MQGSRFKTNNLVTMTLPRADDEPNYLALIVAGSLLSAALADDDVKIVGLVSELADRDVDIGAVCAGLLRLSRQLLAGREAEARNTLTRVLTKLIESQ